MEPCGAGGGDIGIALAESEDALQAFCEQAIRQGFESLDVAVEDEGVQIVEKSR